MFRYDFHVAEAGFMINFFALKGDLLLALGGVESRREIKYLRSGRLDGRVPGCWFSAKELPELGQATCDQQAGCESYLIVDRAANVYVRHSTMFSGDDRFDVDNGGNRDSIEFTPAGKWTDGAIISGRFATLNDTPPSRALMRAVHYQIRKHFTRIRAYWVGPEALAAFRAGRRLTMAIQSPPEYDLREQPGEEFDER
jgi:hypothetical protein